MSSYRQRLMIYQHATATDAEQKCPIQGAEVHIQ